MQHALNIRIIDYKQSLVPSLVRLTSEKKSAREINRRLAETGSERFTRGAASFYFSRRPLSPARRTKLGKKSCSWSRRIRSPEINRLFLHSSRLLNYSLKLSREGKIPDLRYMLGRFWTFSLKFVITNTRSSPS